MFINMKNTTHKSQATGDGIKSDSNGQMCNKDKKDKTQLIFKNPFIKPCNQADICWQWRKSVQASKSSAESLIHVLKWLPCDKCYNCNSCNKTSNSDNNSNNKNNNKNRNDRSSIWVLWDMLSKNVIKFGCPRHDLYDTLSKKFHYYCNDNSMENFIFCNGYSPNCEKSHPIIKFEANREHMNKSIENKKNDELSFGRWLNVSANMEGCCLNCGDGVSANDIDNKSSKSLLYEYKRWSLYDIGAKIDEIVTIDVQYDYQDIGIPTTDVTEIGNQIEQSSISILINRAANGPFIRKMRPGLWKYSQSSQCLGRWVCLFLLIILIIYYNIRILENTLYLLLHCLMFI